MSNLEQIEADLADKNRLPYGVSDAVVRSLIEEVRELRAAPSAQPRQWGPWIEWAGGECPIPDAKAGEYQLRFSHSTRTDNNPIGLPKHYAWKMNAAGCVITAYRVRRPDDDLLRQAIEALRELTKACVEDFGDGDDGDSGAVGGGLKADGTPDPMSVTFEHIRAARAVLALADERGL